MGSRRDRIANEKIVPFHAPATRNPGTHASAIFDLRAGVPVVGAASGGAGREVHTNMLIAVQIGGEWDPQLGTLDLLVYTGNTVTTLTLFATAVQATGAEREDLYLFEIRDLQRYMRVDLVIGGNTTCICSCVGNAERSRREPVYQLGTEKCMGYNKNPASF